MGMSDPISSISAPWTQGQMDAQLAKACSCGDHKSARLMLEKGANPNALENIGSFWPVGGESPLPWHMAARRGDAQMLSLLAEAGADLSLPSLDGKTCVEWLSMSEECAGIWMDHGGDPWRVYPSTTGIGRCYAHVAARGGSLELWSKIIALAKPDQEINPKSEAHAMDTCWPYEDGQLDLCALAIKWESLNALAALGSLGLVPNQRHVEHAASQLLAIGRLPARPVKVLAALFELGAPRLPSDGLGRWRRYMGDDSVERAQSKAEVLFAACEAKALSKAARPGRRKSGMRRI